MNADSDLTTGMNVLPANSNEGGEASRECVFREQMSMEAVKRLFSRTSNQRLFHLSSQGERAFRTDANLLPVLRFGTNRQQKRKGGLFTKRGIC